MDARHRFADRAALASSKLSAAERDALRFFQENREEVLVSSAAALARKIGTSDATVIRTAQALGYSGLDDLRRQLADELRSSLTPAARLTRTLQALSNEPSSVLQTVVDIHVQALEKLKSDIPPSLFDSAIRILVGAARIFIFGLGPSSAMAEYFAIQLGRFGIEGRSIAHTGVLLADDLHRLKKNDAVVIFAYTHVYAELESILARTASLSARAILVTDTLGAALGKQVDLVLPAARGNTDWFSTHTATLGLIEALLIGIAAKQPDKTVAELKALNQLRSGLAGSNVKLAFNTSRRERKKPGSKSST
jgi:DNA-binding MurR/RpiR family transcriptional regulator